MREWILEAYKRSRVYFTDSSAPAGYEWVRIMNERTLEYIVPWANKKMEEGLTIRIRNTKTNEIIPAEILCE